MNEKKIVLFFVSILIIFSFLIRLYRLSEPPRYNFDEVYHVVTARGYAEGNKAAYDPFSTPPEEGTAYDWLHPPLAKLIQAASINILGDNPTAWRLPSAVFGVGIIIVAFLLAYILFGPIVAIFTAAVLSFENMLFVMSRITMNDVFISFFALLAFLFAALYVKKKQFYLLILCSVSLGLAWTSKWTGLYAICGVALYLFIAQFPKVFNPRFLVLVVIPPIIYLASYGQFWLLGSNISDFINLHKQIWWYQSRSDLSHSYATTPLYCVPNGLEGSKEFCPWALDVRPVYFSYEQYGSRAGYIYNLGNPLVFWFGVIAISFTIGKFIEERKKKYLLILIGYFIFWVPWILTPRILFLHHYLPSIAFMAISMGYLLSLVFKTKYWVVSLIMIVLFATVFFYFYPISSGFPIDPKSLDNYMLISKWR